LGDSTLEQPALVACGASRLARAWDRSACDGDRHAGADADNQPVHHVVVEAHAAVGDGAAEDAADVREPVQGDLARAAVERSARSLVGRGPPAHWPTVTH
jgi:hypothetical protein